MGSCKVARESADHLRQLAIPEEHVTGGSSYNHYVMINKPLGSIYRANVPRLKAIEGAVDPTNVMGLAGGLKPPLDGLPSNTICIVTFDYVYDQCEQYNTVYAQ